jgi:hypothetical protein
MALTPNGKTARPCLALALKASNALAKRFDLGDGG